MIKDLKNISDNKINSNFKLSVNIDIIVRDKDGKIKTERHIKK